MDSLYLLIPLAIILVGLAIRLLFWAVKSGQYDDLDTESRRILFDESDQPPAPNPDGHDPAPRSAKAPVDKPVPPRDKGGE